MDKRGQEVRYINPNDLAQLRKYFKTNKKIVMLSLINIGVNVGLRISDLSKIKFENINPDYTIKLREKKTKKIRKIKFNLICQKAIEDLKNIMKNLDILQKKDFYLSH